MVSGFLGLGVASFGEAVSLVSGATLRRAAVVERGLEHGAKIAVGKESQCIEGRVCGRTMRNRALHGGIALCLRL